MLLLIGIIALAGVIAALDGSWIGPIAAYVACGLVWYFRNARRPVTNQIIAPATGIMASWPLALATEMGYLWNNPRRYSITEVIPSTDLMKMPEFRQLLDTGLWQDAITYAKQAAEKTGHEITITDRSRHCNFFGVTMHRTYRVMPNGELIHC